MTAPLSVDLTKLSGGGVLLRCIRADGSVTSQRNDAARGRFFAFHDLTHYAVESVLGCDHGFFGLVAAGWEIAETTGKDARGPLPDEALAIEHLVGMFDADKTNGSAPSAADFNRYAAVFADQHNRAVPPPLSDETLAKIRALESALHSEWVALREGKIMKLSFPGKV